MTHWRIAFAMMLLFTTSVVARAQDRLREKYVGQSSCTTEIKVVGSQYGMRLDKTQNTFLEARKLSETKILLIVQYTPGDHKCGMIRDVIETRQLVSAFEFSCTDLQMPSAVVIGTRDMNDEKIAGFASQAWRIDLKEQKFIVTRDRVSCTREGRERGPLVVVVESAVGILISDFRS